MRWSIGKITAKRAVLTPDKPALIYEDTIITYKMLNDEVNQVAHFFQEKGLKKGDRVSVNLYNCPEFLACYLAAAKLGLIFVPLNYRLISRELEYQLTQCGSRLLVFHDDLTKNIEPIRSSIKVDDDKYVRVLTNGPNSAGCPEWAVDYHKVIQNYPADEPPAEEPIDLDDPLAILYTSGVAGDPKGAVISHGQTYFKNFQIIMYTVSI